MKIKREHKTAFFVIMAIVLAIWGFNYLKGRDLLSNYNSYYTITDNVEGVVVSTPVTLKGIQIGTVKELSFYNGISKTIITLNIYDKFTFSKDSKIKVYGGNIMGGKNVAIIPGTSSEIAKDNDTLQILNVPGMLDLVNDRITPLQEKLESIMNSTDTLLIGLNNIFDPSSQQSIKNSIAQLEKTISHSNQMVLKFNQLLSQNQEHLNNSFKNIDKLSENFVQLSDSLKQLELNKVVKSLNQTIANINTGLDKMTKGEGSMAKLINDKKLYDNLEKSTKELELLLKDLQEHPKKYVHFSIWGRKDKKK
jgi:phospholipid/cholesterol/gamma-HCH transport system substrate-binding protein